MSFPLTIPASIHHQQSQYLAGGGFYSAGVTMVNSSGTSNSSGGGAGGDLCRLVTTNVSHQMISTPSLFVSMDQQPQSQSQQQAHADNSSYSNRMYQRAQQQQTHLNQRDQRNPVEDDQQSVILTSSSESSISPRDSGSRSHHSSGRTNHHHRQNNRKKSNNTAVSSNTTAAASTTTNNNNLGSFDPRTFKDPKCSESSAPERTLPVRKKSVFVAPSGLFAIQQQAAANARSRALSSVCFSPSPPPLTFSPPPSLDDDLVFFRESISSDPYQFPHPQQQQQPQQHKQFNLMPESGQHPLDLSGGDSVLSPSGHPLLPSVVSTTNSTSRSNSVICGSSSVSSITTTTTSGAQQQLSLASKLTVPSREHISEHISNLILNNTAIIESVSPHPSSLLHHHSSRRSTSSAQHSSNTNTTSRSSSSSSSSVHCGGSRYSVPSSTVPLNSTLPVSLSGQYRRYSTEVPSHGISTPNYSKLQSALLGEPSIVESSSAASSNQSNLNHNQNSHSTNQHKAQHVRKYSEISVPSQYSSFQPPQSSQLTQPLYHQIPNQPSLDQFKFPVHPNNNASHYGFHSSIAVAAASAPGITVPSSQYPAQLLIPAYNSQHLQHLQHHPNQLSVIINARDQHQHNLQLSGLDSGLGSGHQSESLRFSPIGESSRSSSKPSLVRNLLTSKTSPFAQLKLDQQHGSHSSPHGSTTSAGSSQFVSKSSNGSIIKNLLLSKSRTTTNTNSTPTTSSQQNPQVQEDLLTHYPSTAASTTTRPNEPARKRSRGLDNNNNNNSSSSSLATDPTNSGSVFSCNLCHVVFRNRQNFEVHQRIYCRGKPSTSTSSPSSNDQLPSAIRKRSYHHYFDSESSISGGGVGATSGLVPPLPPAPSIIKEESDSGSVVRRTSSSIRKVSVQDRPTIITYHVPGYRDHRGPSLDSIDSQDTGHSESTESQYSCTTQRLSRTSLDTEPSSAISPNQPNTATSTTLSTAGSDLQPSSNDASPFGHILKSKLLGSNGSNSLLNKRRKTSEPAFSYNYELKRHARESFAKQPSHHRHVSTLTKPGHKLGHPSQQQQSLEILPAYMPYLIRAPIKITIKGPVQFPILNELIEAGTNHEFRAVSPDELDESQEMDDQDSQEDEEPLCWNQIPQKFDTNQVKVELEDKPKPFNSDSLLVSAEQQKPVALQEKVDQSVEETVSHLLDLVVVDQKEPLFGKCPSSSLEACQDVVDCLNQMLNSVVNSINSSTMTIDNCKVSEVRKTDTTITTTASASNDDHDFKKSNLPKKSCQLERPTTLNFATYDQSARNQNEFGTSRFIDRLNQRFLTANRNQPQSIPPKLSIFVNRCSDQDHDNQDRRRQSKQSLIASTLVSPDTPRSKRKYQQLSINGNAFTNLDLKVAIRTTFCCLYRAQPMFVTQEANPQLSMYSQWKTLPIPAGDILEHLPSPHSLLGAYNSQEAVYLAARCSSGSSTKISTSTSSTITTAAATVNHVGGPYIRMKESVATTCCTTTAAQCLVNQNPGESIKVEQSHYDDEPQSGTENCQSSDQVSTQLSTIHSETTITCATSPTTITSNSHSKINHQLYDRTLCAFVIPLGSGHSDRLKDCLTSSQFVLVHSSQHYQSSLYYKKRSRSHNLIINDYYHHHRHHQHQATNAPQAGDMVIAAGCSLSSMTTTTAGGVTTSSSGDLTTSAVDPNAATSLPIVQNRPRKRSSTVSTNGLPGSGFNGDLSMHPMLDHLPLQSRQVVMYIMMMSQCSPALSIPTVSKMASSMNFAARKFSECIGLRHPNHQQYEENWATRLGPDATAEELIPKRIKIFEGGFKSNEDYTYVRGRGRGKYVCEECGIRCKKPSMLKKHIRTHTDLRPYSCRHCAFAFKTKGNLTKHMKSKAHYKKCVDMGIDPVPISIDESQIDSDALAKQEQYELSCGSSGAFNQFADDDDDCDEDYEDEDCDDEDEEDDEGVPIPLIEQQRLTYVVPGQFDDADNRHQHLLHQQRPMHDTVRKLSTSASRKNSTNSNYNSVKNGSNSSISSGYSSTTSIFNDLQQQFGSENVGAILSTTTTTTSGLPLSQSSLSSTSTLSQIGDSQSIQSHVVRQCLPGNQQPADKIATTSHHHPSQFVDDHQTSNQRDFRETTLQDANTRRLSANMAPSANCNSATGKVSTTTPAAASTSSMSISGDRQHLPYRQLPSNQPNPIIIKSSDTADLVSNYRLNESRRLSEDASASMIAILNNDTAIGGNDNDSGDDSVDNQWRRNNNNNNNSNNGRCRMGPLLQSPANTTPTIGNIATNGNNVSTTTTSNSTTTNEPEAEAARSLLILSGFGQQSSSSSQSQPSLNEPSVTRKLSFINNNNNNLIEPLSEKIILNGIVVGERRRRQPQASLPGPTIPTSSTSSVYNFTDTSEMPMVLEQGFAPGPSQPKSSNSSSSSSSSLLPTMASNQTSVIIARRSSPINHQPYLVDHSMSLSSKKAPPNLPQPFVPRDSSSPIQTQQQNLSKLSPQQKQQSVPNSLFSISSLIGPSVAVSTSTSGSTIPYSRYTPPAPTTAGIAINSGLGSHPYAAIIADDIQRHASISQELLLQARGQHHQLRQSQQQQDLRIHYPHHQQQQQSGPYMGLFDGSSNVSQLVQPIQFANSTLSSQSSNSTNSVSRTQNRRNGSSPKSFETSVTKETSLSTKGSSSLVFQNSSIKNVCEPSAVIATGYQAGNKSFQSSSSSPSTIVHQHFSSPSTNVPLPPPPSSPLPAPTITVATDKRPPSSSSSSSLNNNKDDSEQPIDLSAKASSIVEPHKDSAPKTLVHSPLSTYSLSPDGKLLHHNQPQQKYRQSVESKQHLTEQITRAFSPLSEMQTLPIMDFPPNHHHHQQRLPNHSKNKGRELYNSLRSEDFVHLTPGVHTPHRLPQNVVSLSNSRDNHHPGQSQTSQAGVTSATITTGSSSSPSSRSSLAMQKNSVILSSYTTSEGKSVCTICMKQFSKLSQLRLHVNIHFFERPYRCDSCAVSFRTKGHLQKHSRSVSHLNKLNMNITFGRASSDNPRPFKCSDCKIAFRIHGHLAKHLRSKIHIMKLECLGKLPFGMFAEMERSSSNLNLIDTTNCEKALETLRSLAQKLYDPRQMCWKIPETMEADGMDDDDDDSNLMMDGDELIDGDEMIDGDESFSTSSTNTTTTTGPGLQDQMISSPQDTNNNQQVVVNFNQSGGPDCKQQPTPPLVVVPNQPESTTTTTTTQAATTFSSPSVVINNNNSTSHSSLGGILASTRSNTCHLCGRLFKGAKFLQVHLYCDHPEADQATSSPSNTTTAAAATT